MFFLSLLDQALVYHQQSICLRCQLPALRLQLRPPLVVAGRQLVHIPHCSEVFFRKTKWAPFIGRYRETNSCPFLRELDVFLVCYSSLTFFYPNQNKPRYSPESIYLDPLPRHLLALLAKWLCNISKNFNVMRIKQKKLN